LNEELESKVETLKLENEELKAGMEELLIRMGKLEVIIDNNKIKE